MRSKLLLVLGAFCLAVAAGCAHGSVVEKAPVTADLGSYKTATIAVTVGAGIEKPDVHKSQCALAIEKQLKEKKLFSDVVADGGDLVIKVSLNKVNEGGQILGAATGETEVAAAVELFDSKQNKAVGAFDATGSSKRNTSTSINGTNTSAFGAKSALAHESLGEQVATFIESHRGAK
jgi:hypothetical protein